MKETHVSCHVYGSWMTWPYLSLTPSHTPLLPIRCTPVYWSHFCSSPWQALSSLGNFALAVFFLPHTPSLEFSLAASSSTCRSPFKWYLLRDGFVLEQNCCKDASLLPPPNNTAIDYSLWHHRTDSLTLLIKPVIILFTCQLASLSSTSLTKLPTL